jgi:hypothetical protein
MGNPHPGMTGVLSRPVMALALPASGEETEHGTDFPLRNVEEDRPGWRASLKRCAGARDRSPVKQEAAAVSPRPGRRTPSRTAAA